jgi:tetratricopeptide (TPR) repeat protein
MPRRKLRGMMLRAKGLVVGAIVIGGLAIGVSALTAGLASAQQTGPNPPQAEPPSRQLVEPPAKLPPPQRGDKTRNLDFLFGALKVAPDEASAKAIEGRIWALWQVSGSDTVDLLMERVAKAVQSANYALAVKLLDSVLELKPDYVEALNRRATVFYLQKDYARSLSDIDRVLAREPRHFGALAGLGAILQDMGEDKKALDAYRKALDIYPRLQNIPDRVKSLSEKVEGRDI